MMRHMTTAVWSAARGVPDDVESDVHHGLADPVGQRGQVDVGSDEAAPPARAQRLQHRLLHGGGRVLQELDELRICARRLIERHLQRGAVLHRAARDRGPQFDDLVGDRSASRACPISRGRFRRCDPGRRNTAGPTRRGSLPSIQSGGKGFPARCPPRRRSPAGTSASPRRRSTMPRFAGFRSDECRRRRRLRARLPSRGCVWRHSRPRGVMRERPARLRPDQRIGIGQV